MKTVGNILWLIFGGLEFGLMMFVEGLVLCVTIIFIPVGLQFFKIGKFLLWPMGKKVANVKPNGFKAFVNVLWLIIGGWEHALMFFFVGLIFCITIIGIPFGKQYWKLANFVLWPMGRTFVKAE